MHTVALSFSYKLCQDAIHLTNQLQILQVFLQVQLQVFLIYVVQ